QQVARSQFRWQNSWHRVDRRRHSLGGGLSTRRFRGSHESSADLPAFFANRSLVPVADGNGADVGRGVQIENVGFGKCIVPLLKLPRLGAAPSEQQNERCAAGFRMKLAVCDLVDLSTKIEQQGRGPFANSLKRHAPELSRP